MGKFEVIQQINEQADIVALVSEYVKLEKFGNNYRGLCPFHEEKTPSFTVSPDKKLAYCFGCKKGGSALKFYQQIENISLDEAINRLCKRYGIKNDYNIKVNNSVAKKFEFIMNQVKEYYQFNLENSKFGLEAINYLNKRKIDTKMIEFLKIGLAPKENVIEQLFKNQDVDLKTLNDLGLVNIKNNIAYDLFKERIVFPILDENGLLVGFSGRVFKTNDEPKYLNSPESIIFKKREVLYNLYNAKDEIKDKGFVYLVEGFMDVIAFLKAGIKNVVCSMGTVFTEQHLKLLNKYTNKLIICYDGDNAGKDATLKLVDKLANTNLKVEVILLKDNLDPDEFILKYGKNAFIEYLNKYKIDTFEFSFNRLKENLNINNILEVEAFKNKVFTIIKNAKSNLIEYKYLDKLANYLNIDIEYINKDYNAFLNNKVFIPSYVKKPNKTVENIKISKYLQAERYVIEYMLLNKEYAYAVDALIKDVVDDKNFDLKMKIIDYYETHDNLDYIEFMNNLSEETLKYYQEKFLHIKTFDKKEANYYFEILSSYSDKLRLEQIKKDLLNTSNEEEKILLAKQKDDLLKKLKRR